MHLRADKPLTAVSPEVHIMRKFAYFDMTSLPQPPLPAQNHHHVINSLRKKTKSPTCVQTELCAECPVKISPKPTDFSHLMMFIANLLQPKICTFWGIFCEKHSEKNLLFYLEPTAPSAAFCYFPL